jgi:hypothetical protein
VGAYPKIIAEREQSSMAACWQEYLRVEDEWIVGGELTSRSTGCTYTEQSISSAIDWVRVNGWVPTAALTAELIQAALASAHHAKQ